MVAEFDRAHAGAGTGKTRAIVDRVLYLFGTKGGGVAIPPEPVATDEPVLGDGEVADLLRCASVEDQATAIADAIKCQLDRGGSIGAKPPLANRRFSMCHAHSGGVSSCRSRKQH